MYDNLTDTYYIATESSDWMKYFCYTNTDTCADQTAIKSAITVLLFHSMYTLPDSRTLTSVLSGIMHIPLKSISHLILHI